MLNSGNQQLNCFRKWRARIVAGWVLVGPTGFEPMTYGYLHPAPELYHSPLRESYYPKLFLEPVVLACLDYDPTLNPKNKQTNIKRLWRP